MKKYNRIWIGALVVLVTAMASISSADTPGQDLSPQQFKAMLDARQGQPDLVLLDIRTPKEFKQGHLPGALLVDYYAADFSRHLAAMDRSKTYLIYCRSGNRTSRSLAIFRKLGFERVYHLKSGLVGWVQARYPLTR